jgi:poly(hydroxyalkanoate) depolymerase family esterase
MSRYARDGDFLQNGWLVAMKLAKNMQIALELTRAGDLAGATRAIRNGLARSNDGATDTSGHPHTIAPDPQASTEGSRATNPTALRVENSARAGRIARPLHEVIDALGRLKQRVFDPDAFSGQTKQRAPQIPPGARFETRSIISPQGQRFFKLYVPARPLAEPRSLLIMLHGCTQTPEDFAAGTRMNELAEQNGFIVAYPAQPKSANPSACWNWFNPQNQTRGRGEAAVIVAEAQRLIAEFGIDPRRVFVAGMSAGGAMAAIVAAVYPDAFSAVGIHSGLPYRSASDVVSALAAMRGKGAPSMQSYGESPLVPTIVFHGSADRIVHPSNGARINDAHLGSREVHQGTASDGNGRSFQRMITRDHNGRIKAEYWVIEGAGHAWSGGSPDGSFADPLGPNASREMVRFFLDR